jgi:hypothetical protein
MTRAVNSYSLQRHHNWMTPGKLLLATEKKLE